MWPLRVACDKRLSGTKPTQKEGLCLFERAHEETQVIKKGRQQQFYSHHLLEKDILFLYAFNQRLENSRE